MRPRGPWDKPLDLDNPPDRNAPPAGLSNDELEWSNYYHTGKGWQILLVWGTGLVLSLCFWALVIWALFFKKG